MPSVHPNTREPDERRAYFAQRVQYLDRVHNMFRDYKARAIDFTRLAPGQQVLDIGSGAGNDALTIAAKVSPGGDVTGVDSDKGMVAEAASRLARQPPPSPTRFLQANAQALPFDDDTFDRTRSDRVFQYFTDPAAALAEMIRVTRERGLVVALDVDWETLVVDSDHRDLTRRILHHACDGEVQGWMGRKLYGLFKRARMADVDTMSENVAITTLEDATFLLGLASFAAKAADAGIVSADEAERWMADLRDRDRNDAFFCSVTGFGVRGAKHTRP